MSLTDAIKELLEQRRNDEDASLDESYPGAGQNKEESAPMQGSSKKAEFEVVNKGKGGDKGGDKQPAPKVASFEASPAKQGSSKDAGWESLEGDDTGKQAAAKMSKTAFPAGHGAGAAPNFKTVADPTSVVNQPSSKGNVAVGESVATLFADETTLSEEFKTKATGLFEALVLARLAEERELMEAEVAQVAVDAIMEAEASLVEHVDKYLNYIAETWMNNNQVAADNAIKVELAESFFDGLRTLYADHHVTLPEEGTDVIALMSEEIADLKAQLNNKIEEGVNVSEEITALRKTQALTEASAGLALTEAEKLATLCADVVYEDRSTFLNKVSVIRSSYFPKSKLAEAVSTTSDVEETDGEVVTREIDPEMARYTAAISNSAKF